MNKLTPPHLSEIVNGDVNYDVYERFAVTLTHCPTEEVIILRASNGPIQLRVSAFSKDV